jgi:hypothetical protein
MQTYIFEKCENSSCDIKSCNLRHPRSCKFFRDYKGCKFGEWCVFNQKDNSDEGTLKEKIQNLEVIINEKDELIKELAERIKRLEEVKEINESLNDEVNTTFFNPSLGFQCEICDFLAKSKAGLQVHVKSKHKECSETTQLEPEITVVNAQEIIEEENYIEHAQGHVIDNNTECENKCERCEFTSENKTDLETHMDKNHSDFEIKLEVVVLFVNLYDDDVGKN